MRYCITINKGNKNTMEHMTYNINSKKARSF